MYFGSVFGETFLGGFHLNPIYLLLLVPPSELKQPNKQLKVNPFLNSELNFDYFWLRRLYFYVLMVLKCVGIELTKTLTLAQFMKYVTP